MNKEEKKAIKNMKVFARSHEDMTGVTAKEINKALKLIEKQQKEIEELEAKNKQYQGIEKGTTIIYKSKAKYVREDRIEKYYINKNKIREIIKEKAKTDTYNFKTIDIKDLEELLGE